MEIHSVAIVYLRYEVHVFLFCIIQIHVRLTSLVSDQGRLALAQTTAFAALLHLASADLSNPASNVAVRILCDLAMDESVQSAFVQAGGVATFTKIFQSEFSSRVVDGKVNTTGAEEGLLLPTMKVLALLAIRTSSCMC